MARSRTMGFGPPNPAGFRESAPSRLVPPIFARVRSRRALDNRLPSAAPYMNKVPLRLFRLAPLALALALFPASCSNDKAGADMGAAPAAALPPVPAPEGLLADVILGAPDATWQRARALVGGPAMFLPSNVGGLATTLSGFPSPPPSSSTATFPSLGPWWTNRAGRVRARRSGFMCRQVTGSSLSLRRGRPRALPPASMPRARSPFSNRKERSRASPSACSATTSSSARSFGMSSASARTSRARCRRGRPRATTSPSSFPATRSAGRFARTPKNSGRPFAHRPTR